VAHPASYSVDIRSPLPGYKAARHKADHSPVSNANVQNVWSYNSTSIMAYAFMVEALLHLLLLLSAESSNHEKCLHRPQIAEHHVFINHQNNISISQVDYKQHNDALG
jgi:hypothetical protein